MTKFAVALPVFNGAAFLREALDSVLSQDFGDFELVVSDNQSTDETASILADYAARDSRLRVSRSPEFLPQARNANRAVELCNAEWIKILCHDDLLLPGCMRALAEAVLAKADSVGLVGHAEEWLFGNGYRFRMGVESADIREWEGREFVRYVLMGRSPVPLPSLTTAMVRKEAWFQAGKFDERFVHFDVFLWAKVLLQWKYRFVPTVLTANRIHGAQVATAARKTIRSVQDQRVFWPEFVHQHRAELDLGWSAQGLASLKALSVAGAHVAIELIRREPASALDMVRRLPVHYWPLLPVFVARGLRAERAKLKTLLPQVPLDLIYPT